MGDHEYLKDRLARKRAHMAGFAVFCECFRFKKLDVAVALRLRMAR